MSAERGISPNPEEKGFYKFRSCIDDLNPSITPFDAMEIIKEKPQDVFPFPIDGVGGDSVEVGRVYELRPLFVDTEEVTVIAETETSFTFIADEDHLRGENALLTSSTTLNEKGEVCLNQEAVFKKNRLSPILNLGSRMMWRIQGERLKRRLNRKDFEK